MRYAKEMIESKVYKGTPFKVLPARPVVVSTSPTGPFAAQVPWRVGRCCMRGKNRLEVGVSAREGEGHKEGEGSRFDMPAMMTAEGGSLWHGSM